MVASGSMLTNKYGPWCLIAGGSEGIGSAFAREVAAHGINLFLLARKPGPLEETASELRTTYPGVQVRTLPIDLGRPDAGAEVKAATRNLEVGFLIFNAGAETLYADFLDQGWEHVHSRLQR